jgi:group I intron endonuclease
MSPIQPIPQFVSTQPGNRSGVYVIRCSNGKVYVGSSANIERRWREHRNLLEKGKSPHRHLQSAWRKYGAANFEWGVLEFCETSHLLYREQVYLDLLRSYEGNFGYNTCVIPNSQLGIKRSEELKAKQSAMMKAVMACPEMRAKIIGVSHTPEVQARRNATHRRPEVKLRQRDAMRRTLAQPEAKARKSAASKRARNLPEAKAKCSIAAKAAFAKPEVKARHAAAVTEALNNPETKARHKAALKAAWARRKAAAAEQAREALLSRIAAREATQPGSTARHESPAVQGFLF